jgi:DtxR family transcriptional regulator, Mn-dependent transcriptional regulator
MIHPVSDEILERLWYFREREREAATLADLKLTDEGVHEAAAELQSRGLIHIGEQKVELLPPGEQLARAVVRRHRLAEILFNQVLDIELSEAEASACEFEHMLAETVVDRVCAFLGHPPKCPHGRAIPQGACCRTFDRRVEPLIVRLSDLALSGSGKVVFIAPKSPARLNRLANLGVVPGTIVRLLQKRPSVVISCGETSIALEEEIANEIYVKPGGAAA